jgi:acyl dehydratase
MSQSEVDNRIGYEDLELGDELPEATPDVSLERVRRFCEATGMVFGRFLDDEAARSEGLPGAIVPGIMSQGLLAAMIHAWAPGCRVKKLDTIFRAPILVGSTPTCRGAITDTDDEARTVEIDLTLVNEAGETRVVGTALVAL